MAPQSDSAASPSLALMAHAFRRVAGALLLAAAASAHGQADDAERCASITGNPDLAIQHCTRAIDSGKLSGDTLAQMHYSRAFEWAIKNDNDRAIADYDAAIRINPKYANAYYNRGIAWGAKGDPDRAIADYDTFLRLAPKDPSVLDAHIARAGELMVKGDYARAAAGYDTAIALQPKSGTALMGRGRAYFYSGDPQRSVADLEQAMKTEPSVYTAVWLYLARKRAKTINAEEMLDSETRGRRDGNWPSAVIMLYLGRTDLDSVTASALDRDPKRDNEQRCEASFYLAHWHLLRNENDRALALLKQAQSGCPKDFLEHEGAVAELRRLAKP
jgi:lipoprotein NlpI